MAGPSPRATPTRSPHTPMQRTIYDTPGVCTVLRWFSIVGLRLAGWRCEGERPSAPKYVLVASPHTSNWDWVVFMAMVFVYRARLFYMVKNNVFRGPFGPIVRWLGGIPIDRSKASGVVEQMADHFRQAERLELAVPVEGTRRPVKKWKTGFYHVAHLAQVPIVLGFLDFGKKVGGFGPSFMPTGDIEADIVHCQNFYEGMLGKNPAWMSPIRVSIPEGELEDTPKQGENTPGTEG